MKMIFCGDTRLGVDYPEYLDVKRLRKWQKTRFDAFAELVDTAVKNHAAYISLFGDVLGKDRVPESIIDELFKAASSEPTVNLLLFLFQKEFNRFGYRNDIPDNLHLISVDQNGTFLDDNVAVRADGKIKIQFDDNDAVEVFKDTEGSFYLKTPKEESLKKLLSFEPVGFDEAPEKRYGYSILEWRTNSIDGYSEIDRQSFRYKTIDVKILPEDDQKSILKKVVLSTKGLDFNTFVRISIHGKLAFGTVVGCDAIRDQLHNKLFYAEVFDNTVPSVIYKLKDLLKINGILYASFKYGPSERIKGGRYFRDMNEQSLTELILSADLTILELFTTIDVRPGREEEKWINVIAEKRIK